MTGFYSSYTSCQGVRHKTAMFHVHWIHYSNSNFQQVLAIALLPNNPDLESTFFLSLHAALFQTFFCHLKVPSHLPPTKPTTQNHWWMWAEHFNAFSLTSVHSAANYSAHFCRNHSINTFSISLYGEDSIFLPFSASFAYLWHVSKITTFLDILKHCAN